MTMITPSYLGETIEYSSLHACRSTLEDPTELIEFARTQAKNRDELELLEDDVERYFASTRDAEKAEGDDAWLQEAKSYLPPHLYQRVAELARAGQGEDLSFVGSTRFDD